MRVLIATNNRGKLVEFQTIFADLPLDLLTLADAGIDWDVDETGETFAENAALKARTYGAASGLPTIADDSGLAVDALDGFPGVRSARWTGPTEADRNAALLERMAAVPSAERGARFVCEAMLWLPDGREFTARGELIGQLLDAPRGSNGFGYDPLFLLPELGRTLAELERAEKNRLSHRGRAAEALKPVLLELAGMRREG